VPARAADRQRAAGRRHRLAARHRAAVAAVLAVVLGPVQARFAELLRGRPKLSATLIVFAVLALVIGPLVALSAVAVNEATAGARFLVETVRGEGFEGLIARLPGPLERLANEALSALGDVTQ